jgi:hypothetical protein
LLGYWPCSYNAWPPRTKPPNKPPGCAGIAKILSMGATAMRGLSRLPYRRTLMYLSDDLHLVAEAYVDGVGGRGM